MKAFLLGILAVLYLPFILIAQPPESGGVEVQNPQRSPKMQRKLSHTHIERLKVGSAEHLKFCRKECVTGDSLKKNILEEVSDRKQKSSEDLKKSLNLK